MGEEDLLIEVLSRLDVKTILLCKAVCKRWYSLISSPMFIRSHLNYALTTNNNKPLIVRLFEIFSPELPQQSGSYSLFQLGGCDQYKAHFGFPFSKGDYPFPPPSLLVGSVCGIVCVCVVPSDDINEYSFTPDIRGQTDIYIWNPATKQSKLIPPHNNPDDKVRVSIGFGFDPISFDFKVVRVVVSGDVFPEVYSLETNVWRNIEKLSDVPQRSVFNICIHGFLFMVGLNGVIAFDLNKEVFICDIQLPVHSNVACFADFNDSVAVIMFYFKEKLDRIKLWTLDDEACLRGTGVHASWTMKLTIDVGLEINWVYGLFNSVEFLLMNEEWLLYDLDRKVTKHLQPDPLIEYGDVFEYTESLLPVAGSKLVNWSDGEDDNEYNSVDLEDNNEDKYEQGSIGVVD